MFTNFNFVGCLLLYNFQCSPYWCDLIVTIRRESVKKKLKGRWKDDRKRGEFLQFLRGGQEVIERNSWKLCWGWPGWGGGGGRLSIQKLSYDSERSRVPIEKRKKRNKKIGWESKKKKRDDVSLRLAIHSLRFSRLPLTGPGDRTSAPLAANHCRLDHPPSLRLQTPSTLPC